jgi:tRNA pseudouridine55 synthase
MSADADWPSTAPAAARTKQQPRSTRVAVDGWVCLDKPPGITSTQAVGRLKHLFNAKKAGHAGTLDPLASGVLPVAFGEATKATPVAQDGVKVYGFTVKWGEERDTDDAEGRIVATSDARPDAAAIRALLPEFIGAISQTPPAYSAIKIGGERAYDLARDGVALVLAARQIVVHRLELLSCAPDAAVFEAECGKGTYVRAIARDLGRRLGCYGHVAALRRTRVGPFLADRAVALDALSDGEALARALQPVAAGLAELPCVALDRDAAAALRRGQTVLLRGAHAPVEGPAYAACFGAPVAYGVVEAGRFVSTRVFNPTR